MASAPPVEGHLQARIPTLDGWRGIAILLVLADHTAFYTQFHNHAWAGQGCFGVDIFFVISGYIITTSLIRERAERGTFCLKSFYVRRARRILPLVIAYLVVLAVFFRDTTSGSELLGSLFFFRNYQLAALPDGGTHTFHFWSLSIEEQFYLLWPPLLLFLGNERATWFAIGTAIICGYSGSRLSDLFSPSSIYYRIVITDVRIDGLMLGCALALLLAQPKVHRFIFRNFVKEIPILCGFPILLLYHRGVPSFATDVLITVAIASTLVVGEGIAHKWLNFGPLTWIGRISFSLYVWQQLFLFHPEGHSWIPAPLNLICTFLVAALSFYFIEQPLRKQSFWTLN